MVSKESNCVGCTSMGLHCMGSACPNSRPALVIKCDACGKDADVVWEFDGIELCEECIKREQKKEFLEFLGDEWYNEVWDEYRDSYLDGQECISRDSYGDDDGGYDED